MRDFLCTDLSGTAGAISTSVPDEACLILQYHRVASLCFDPFQWAVEPYNFEGQIEYLARNFNVLSMDEMKRHLETSRPFEQRSVVITFDGGYPDVLYTAKEVLDRFDVPATVFASSANIIENGPVWWKELEDYLIANCVEDVPPSNRGQDARDTGRLELEIDGRFCTWPLSTQLERFRAYDDLYLILSNQTAPERDAIIEQITTSLDLRGEEFDDHRTLSAGELKELAEGGRITIGGHTHSYVKLSRLPRLSQVEEIRRNKGILEEVLRRKIEYFAYPFGYDDGYTPETVQLLRDAGYSLACGGSYGTVSATRGDGFYELPRVKVGNWGTFAFYRFLRRFFQ
jgi:peptidoglycan/xylan/chitin deacetylase (PgdA/CDA1 family)